MTEVEVEVEPTGGHCTREGCPANEGGECALDHDDPALECDEWQLEPDGEEDHATAETGPDYVVLPSGEALRSHELEHVLARQATAIVVPLGGVSAGKTTLIALAHQLMCAGQLEEWQYAGSTTSIGFMRRNYYASLRSKRNDPLTPRTPREQSGWYLHIDARNRKTDELHSVLLSDVAGESVDDLVDGKVPQEIAAAVSWADHVPIVISGAALADPRTRNHAQLRARTLMQMVERNLSPSGQISVVVTQYDLLVAYELDELAIDLTQGTIAEDAPLFLTAACAPKAPHRDPNVRRGHGVEAFFSHVSQKAAPRELEAPAFEMPVALPILKRLWKHS